MAIKPEEIDKIEAEQLAAVNAAADQASLEEIRVNVLGKKGSVSLLMRELGNMSPEERQVMGPKLNGLKDSIADAIEVRHQFLFDAAMDERLASEAIDITLPARARTAGHIHPISQVMDECVAIFADMGFALREGPDIEDDFHNFTALNIPPEHPARQMHDTFYLSGSGDKDSNRAKPVLRTHTSPVQVRIMLAEKPPYRFIAPGRTYRKESDATHTPMFHQIEGLVIDHDIHMGHLKGCIEEFVKAFFEVDEVTMRFRPSFFPFTEPSAEVDIGCRHEAGEIVIGEGDDWLEIAGCGMVHPKVLENVNLDPEEWQGFAFGMGVDRPAMLKYGIPDLRAMFESDVRWLDHYGFSPFDVPSLLGGLSR